jgi:hypothetical protein
MMFVRCGAGGVSHNPAETVTEADGTARWRRCSTSCAISVTINAMKATRLLAAAALLFFAAISGALALGR